MQLSPKEYSEMFYEGRYHPATIRNWCKAGKLKAGQRFEVTPTGQYLIHIDEQPKTKAEELFRMMEKRVA